MVFYLFILFHQRCYSWYDATSKTIDHVDLSNYNFNDFNHNKYYKKETLVRLNKRENKQQSVNEKPKESIIVVDNDANLKQNSQSKADPHECKVISNKSNAVIKKDDKIDDEGFSSFYTLEMSARGFKNTDPHRLYLRSVSTLRRLPLLRDDKEFIECSKTVCSPPIVRSEMVSLGSNDHFDTSSGLYEEIPKSVESTVLSEILDGYHSEEAPTI